MKKLEADENVLAVDTNKLGYKYADQFLVRASEMHWSLENLKFSAAGIGVFGTNADLGQFYNSSKVAA